MKKASDIVLLVGSILGFITSGCLLICSIFFILLSTPLFTDVVREGIENGTVNTTAPDVETAIAFLVAVFIVMAVFFIIIAVLCAVASILGLKARKENRKGLYIVALVFGALGNEVILVGSIFGLISNKKEEPNNEVIDMTK